MDHQGRVVAWNEAAESMFGWSHEEAIGVSMAELIVPTQHRYAHTAGLAHYNATGEGPVLEKRLKITALDKMGIEFPIELSIFPMRQPDGDVFYAFIRSLVFEEAHRLNQEMRVQEAELLLAVSTALLEDTSLEDFTQFCLRKICEVASLDAAHLFYIRGTGKLARLQPSGIWHISDPKFEVVVDDTRNRTFQFGEGLPGEAWKNGTLAEVSNIPNRNNFLRRESFGHVGLVQGVAVPIAQEDRIFGVMEFFGAEAARIDEDVKRLLRTVAKQIGIAVQRKAEADERDILRRELSHRVGNSLTILSALFRATAAKSTSVSDLSTTFMAHVRAVARAHESLRESDRMVSLKTLVSDAVELLPDKALTLVELPDVKVSADAVLPLALVISELATNHLKHGTLGEQTISVEANWNQDRSSMRILWIEAGAHESVTVTEGYGSFLIRAMIVDRLGGHASRTFDERGLVVEVKVPSHFLD
jgi:PAS domain S-box-containing protein